MDFSAVKAITIPEGIVQKIVSDGVTLWQAVTYKNWVKYSTESDGVTIYNGGLGYKNGYRIRSGGSETKADNSVCTGYIECKAGQTIRVYCPQSSAYSGGIVSINAYDIDKTNLGQCASNGLYGIFTSTGEWDKVTIDNGLLTYTMPTNITSANQIAFIRFTNHYSAQSQVTGEGMIITIDEEIE